MASSGFYIHLIHPLIVHFPIVLAFVTLIVVGWSLLPRREELEGVALGFSFILALTAVLAYLTGQRAHEVVHEHFSVPHQALEMHEEWGERTTYYFVSLAILWGIWFFVKRGKVVRRLVMGVACAVGVILTIFTGRSGGDLVYRHGAGVLPLAEPTLFLSPSSNAPTIQVVPHPSQSPLTGGGGSLPIAPAPLDQRPHQDHDHDDDHE